MDYLTKVVNRPVAFYSLSISKHTHTHTVLISHQGWVHASIEAAETHEGWKNHGCNQTHLKLELNNNSKTR